MLRTGRDGPFPALTTHLPLCSITPGRAGGENRFPCQGGGRIFRSMTKLLQKALEAVRRLPPDSQDEIARAMLTLAGDESETEAIDPAHLPDVLESLAQAQRRQLATDSEVEAAFRRFDA